MESTYRTGSFYEAAYLMTVMDIEPTLKGREFIFADETGEVEWAAQSFYQDQTVTKFCSALKKLRNMRNGPNAYQKPSTPRQEQTNVGKGPSSQ